MPGVPGELYIGGMGVSRGYYNKPEKNAEAFVPNPFNPADPSDRLYRTGDVVRMLDTGDLFLGREDHQINLRGYRIEAGGDRALREHESVTEAVVVPARTRRPRWWPSIPVPRFPRQPCATISPNGCPNT